MSDTNTMVGCGDRIFTFQEVVLASKSIWHKIESFMSIIGGAEQRLFVTLNSCMWVVLFMEQLQSLSRRLEHDQSIRYSDLQLPLFNLGQNAQANLLHDKIYGTLAIMPEAVASAMVPYIDYRLPVQEVFVAFSKAIIAYTDTLDFIHARNYHQTMEPSWVVDWELSPDRVSLLHDWHIYGFNRFANSYTDLHTMVEMGRIFRADDGRKAFFEISPESSTLRCSGILIGKIDGIAAAMPILGAVQYDAIEHVQPTCKSNPYGGDEATRRALAHTLFANPIWGDQEEVALFQIPWLTGESYIGVTDALLYVDEVSQANLVYFHFGGAYPDNEAQLNGSGWSSLFAYGNYGSFESWRVRWATFMVGGKRFRDYFPTEMVQCSVPDDRIFLDLAKVVGGSLGRTLVTLATGHFGLAPYVVKPDDLVFVVMGCSMPVVLRPVEGTSSYTVVGECYVEGFAKGEAMAGLDEGKYELQTLTLC